MSIVTKIFYLRAPHDQGAPGRGEPIACIAYKFVGSTLQFQISTKHPADTFDRARGRITALKRLERRPFVEPFSMNLNGELLNGLQTLNCILQMIVEDGQEAFKTRHFSKQVHEAAARAIIARSPAYEKLTFGENKSFVTS